MTLRAEWNLFSGPSGYSATSEVPEPWQSPDPKKSFREYLLAYAEHEKRRAEELRRIEGRLLEVVALLRQALAEGDQSLDVDELVALYSKAEEDFKAHFLPRIAEAKRRKKTQLSLPISPADRAFAVRVWDQDLENSIRALELARDARWAMMALRSTVESGGSPIFADSDQLQSYLDQL
jgi:hypothetical protein